MNKEEVEENFVLLKKKTLFDNDLFLQTWMYLQHMDECGVHLNKLFSENYLLLSNTI